MGDPARYEVHRGGEKVLSFAARPGHLRSTALPPPGFRPPEHPFLDARALDARFEHELAELVEKAKSVDDFIHRLQSAGYDVRPE